jgi:divalent metal cation (Fe/Co/Zn/Cd) transporter
MTVETLVSIPAGIIAGSIALLAFGGDSVIELLSGVVVAGDLRKLVRARGVTSGSEARVSRAEKSTLYLLVSLIPLIGSGAVYSLLAGIRPEESVAGIVVAIGAVVIMPVLWLEKKRLGLATKYVPLTIDATESATCFLMSLSLLSGLLLNYVWKLWWTDYLAAGIILVFVAREAKESLGKDKHDHKINEFPEIDLQSATYSTS